MYIQNKQALYEYNIMDRWEAGIKLVGSEVKSIRSGRVDLGQSFVRVIGDELVLVNAHIPAYQNAPIKNYDPHRSRKLLLHRKEIESLIGKTSGKGVTLVPVAIYDKHNLIKVEIGLARSKKEFDKRQIKKQRDNLRREEQELRGKE